jgi:hypothetical protein
MTWTRTKAGYDWGSRRVRGRLVAQRPLIEWRAVGDRPAAFALMGRTDDGRPMVVEMSTDELTALHNAITEVMEK